MIAEALRTVGIAVEAHDDHLAANAPDEEWIALIGRKHWLAITKDKNIRYRTAELEAIKEHDAKVLVVRAKNATGQDIADRHVRLAVRRGLDFGGLPVRDAFGDERSVVTGAFTTVRRFIRRKKGISAK